MVPLKPLNTLKSYHSIAVQGWEEAGGGGGRGGIMHSIAVQGWEGAEGQGG